MKNIILVGSALFLLLSCGISHAVTTQERIDKIKGEMEQKSRFITKEEVVSMVGIPDKTQILVGVYYFIYETEEKENYIISIDEYKKHIDIRKIDPNDPKIIKLFNIKVNVLGIPLDEEGHPIFKPKEEAQKTKEPKKEKTPNQKLAEKYYNKAMGFSFPPEKGKEIENLSKAIELDPDYEMAYLSRGSFQMKLGNIKEAIMDYEKSIELSEKSIELGEKSKGMQEPVLYNTVAWLLATCKEPQYRDGNKAVQYAEKAVALGKKVCYIDDNTRAGYLNTLAAAYAETGDFDKAVMTEMKAYDKYKPENKDDSEKDTFKELIESYKNKKTYVQWEEGKNSTKKQE